MNDNFVMQGTYYVISWYEHFKKISRNLESKRKNNGEKYHNIENRKITYTTKCLSLCFTYVVVYGFTVTQMK